MGSTHLTGDARTPLFGSYTYHTSTLDLLVRPYNRGNRSPQSMPAKDLFHATVRKALEKDGWVITADPLVLTIGLRSVFIDLGAEKLIAAERGAEKIAVEVKSFIGASPISDLEVACPVCQSAPATRARSQALSSRQRNRFPNPVCRRSRVTFASRTWLSANCL